MIHLNFTLAFLLCKHYALKTSHSVHFTRTPTRLFCETYLGVRLKVATNKVALNR